MITNLAATGTPGSANPRTVYRLIRFRGNGLAYVNLHDAPAPTCTCIVATILLFYCATALLYDSRG